MPDGVRRAAVQPLGSGAYGLETGWTLVNSLSVKRKLDADAGSSRKSLL